MKKDRKELIPFSTIEAATTGDVNAINEVIDYFQPYINSKCRRKYIDDSNQRHYGIDEEMKRRMETKLITKILEFKIQP